MAATRVAEYEKVLERKLETVVSGLRGTDLAGNLQYENPFQKANGLQPVIHADFVTDSSGTGLVHFAPGHGMDDYHVCQAMGIPAFAPIDDAGAFTRDAFPEQPELLEGLLVSDEKEPARELSATTSRSKVCFVQSRITDTSTRSIGERSSPLL